MSDSGREHLEEIQGDLECPACQYNLRGLRGEVVQCPECGMSVNVAHLIARRWQIAWNKAPGYTKIAGPVLPAAVGALVFIAFLLVVVDRAGYIPPQAVITMLSIVLGFLLIWLYQIWRIYMTLDGIWGVRMCLVAHLVLAGYLVCSWGSLIFLGYTVFGSMFIAFRAVTLLIAVGLAVSLVYLFRADRALGTAMIARYLRHQPTLGLADHADPFR